MRNALAELAMRLVDAQDREEFHKADGVTAIVDHLARILEEQATLNYAWNTSEVFGTTWEEYEVHDSLQFTLVALCHASIDSEIAAEMLELDVLETLFQVLSTLPTQINDYVSFVLECCRNLCGSDFSKGDLPPDFVQSMWEILLSENEAPPYWQEVAAEILTNLAALDTARVSATQEKLSSTLSLFLQAAANPETANFGIALADLLCNLCCDQACCLLLICELDTRRPRGHLRHSGVVYLVQLTENAGDDALKQSMEALVHNLSWSDPAGKRTIQKLALSSYMNRFALERAISS
ncbi:Zinc-binding alcohol dehydrogenase domain-containing protein 2 [Phytophthora cinnamomi]|uniref:Zinc-binding alcohol dehydrogenase domain-containing protein 2 n=1 Tax=Phytophthora cinnamomi TaxID=4785 RepID=UPI003559CF77|nr:Zinc-binding alcohol dehydrogenase domain-containing protein 2 [Phytophthora cinnamomi]